MNEASLRPPFEKPVAWVSGAPAVATALALSVTGVLMFKVLPLIVGAAADEFGLQPQQIGLLASSDLAGITLASLLGPLWVRRANWRVLAFAALAIVALGNAASAAVDVLAPLLAIRVVTGFGEGMASALALVVLSDTRNPDRAFGLAVGAPILVGLLAFQAMPPLVQAYGYDGVVLALAGLAVLFMAGVPFLPTHGRPVTGTPTGARRAVDGTAVAGEYAPGGAAPADGKGASLAAVASRVGTGRGPVAAALVAALVYHVGLGAVWAFVERMGVAAGFGRAQVGATLGLAVVFGLAGSLLATAVGVRLGRLWPIALAVAGQCAALALLVEPMTATGFAIAACAFQFLWLLCVPYQLGLIAAADRGGRVFVLALAFQAAGVALGPVLAGFLLGPEGFAPVRWLAAACLLASLAVFIPVTRRLR